MPHLLLSMQAIFHQSCLHSIHLSNARQKLILLHFIVTVKKFIPPELLDEFKEAVAGSDSTKLGIIEELKKR